MSDSPSTAQVLGAEYVVQPDKNNASGGGKNEDRIPQSEPGECGVENHDDRDGAEHPNKERDRPNDCASCRHPGLTYPPKFLGVSRHSNVGV